MSPTKNTMSPTKSLVSSSKKSVIVDMPKLNLDLIKSAYPPLQQIKVVDYKGKSKTIKKLPKEPKKYIEEYKKRNRSKIHDKDLDDEWDVEERSESFVPDMKVETPKKEPNFDLFRNWKKKAEENLKVTPEKKSKKSSSR